MTGNAITVQSTALVQLTPACRIKSRKFLADGRPLEEGVPTPCRYFEAVEEYDIIAPDSVLEAVKKSPGQKVDFVAAERDTVVNNRIVYQFQPAGACVIHHRATALRDFDLGYMGFIQSSPLQAGEASRLQACIPKTLPFSAGGKNYDFRDLQDLTKAPTEPLLFSIERGNVADAANLPDRFIQILHAGERKAGFAMGYSILHGQTKPAVRAANTGSPLFIFTSRKTYPAAIDRKAEPIKAGEEFECLAYQQNFDPSSHPDASFVYGNKQNGDYILCAEYHRTLERTGLLFPREFWGETFEVLEKSDSIEIRSVGNVPAEGVKLAVRGVRGSVALRVRASP